MEQYLHDMKITQAFAELNRSAIADEIVKGMKLDVEDTFSTIHNFVLGTSPGYHPDTFRSIRFYTDTALSGYVGSVQCGHGHSLSQTEGHYFRHS